MHILIVNNSVLPVTKYGGTERVIWYLGKELAKQGHKVTYLVNEGSSCDFANVLYLQKGKTLNELIPENVDVVHLNIGTIEKLKKPYIITMHGNINTFDLFDLNTVFVSANHANRFGSTSYVHNGLDWDDYGKPDFNNQRNYFHFLGDAAWRIKNVKGAITSIHATAKEKIKILGGKRLNVSQGFRFTTTLRAQFCGMVGGEKKLKLLNGSKGLVFPVRWHEPFGLAITESLYFGCPVFGTPYGSLSEIVTAEFGFLSNRKAELANAIENVSSYSNKHCHEYALEIFNAKKMTNAYLLAYEKVLSGKTLNEKAPQLIHQQAEKFLDWFE
jgi:glycosyltransferase involved in cell wall biosynthesis